MPRTKGATTKKKVARQRQEQVAPSAPRSLNQYDAATISKTFKLFLLYNGASAPQVVAEMRKEYPWFSEKRLDTLVKRYNWREALKTKVETDAKAALTTADQLVDEIEGVRKKLFNLIDVDGVLDKETINQHRDYCRLSTEALTKVKAERDTLGGFKGFYRRFLTWLGDYSPHAVDAVLQVEEQLLTRAARELVDAESDNEKADA